MKDSANPRLASIVALMICLPLSAKTMEPLRLVQTIKLSDVEGRIDHLAVDASGHRLLVAALGHNTVEVVDLTNGSVANEIRGLNEPQGVAFLADDGLIAVASGADGSCRFFTANTLKPTGSLDYPSDADNLRYDSKNQQLFVGYGDGSLGAIDAKKRSKLFDIKLAGHPESFQLRAVAQEFLLTCHRLGKLPSLTGRQGGWQPHGRLTRRRLIFPWRSMRTITGYSSAAGSHPKCWFTIPSLKSV